MSVFTDEHKERLTSWCYNLMEEARERGGVDLTYSEAIGSVIREAIWSEGDLEEVFDFLNDPYDEEISWRGITVEEVVEFLRLRHIPTKHQGVIMRAMVLLETTPEDIDFSLAEFRNRLFGMMENFDDPRSLCDGYHVSMARELRERLVNLDEDDYYHLLDKTRRL